MKAIGMGGKYRCMQTHAQMHTYTHTETQTQLQMIARMHFTSDCNLRDVFSKINPGMMALIACACVE